MKSLLRRLEELEAEAEPLLRDPVEIWDYCKAASDGATAAIATDSDKLIGGVWATHEGPDRRLEELQAWHEWWLEHRVTCADGCRLAHSRRPSEWQSPW